MVEVDVAGLRKDSKDSTLMFGVELACSCEVGLLACNCEVGLDN